HEGVVSESTQRLPQCLLFSRGEFTVRDWDEVSLVDVDGGEKPDKLGVLPLREG
ncbi:unnamed protein product, partial [Pylaiella littoralis]